MCDEKDPMSVVGIVLIVLTGAFGGWLAGLASHGKGFGMVGNPGIGIVGALAGARILDEMGAGAMMVGFAALFAAFVVAMLLLTLMTRIRRFAAARQ